MFLKLSSACSHFNYQLSSSCFKHVNRNDRKFQLPRDIRIKKGLNTFDIMALCYYNRKIKSAISTNLLSCQNHDIQNNRLSTQKVCRKERWKSSLSLSRCKKNTTARPNKLVIMSKTTRNLRWNWTNDDSNKWKWQENCRNTADLKLRFLI